MRLIAINGLISLICVCVCVCVRLLTWSTIFRHQLEQQSLTDPHSFQQTNPIYKESTFFQAPLKHTNDTLKP